MDDRSSSRSFAAIARACGASLRRWSVEAATPGSAGSLVLATCLGVAAFAMALASSPILPHEAEAASPPARPDLPLTDVSLQPASSTVTAPVGLAPIGAPPPPAIDLALNFEVTYFWPETPQTVAAPVAIRAGPAPWAKVLRQARPGERLRINGRVVDAPEGPWLRARLADGRDGFFAARTVDAGIYRRRRASAATSAETAPPDTFADIAGAPLMPTPPPDEAPDFDISGPPSF